MATRSFWSNTLSDKELEFIKAELQADYLKGQGEVSDSVAIRIALSGYADTLRKAAYKRRKESDPS